MDLKDRKKLLATAISLSASHLPASVPVVWSLPGQPFPGDPLTSITSRLRQALPKILLIFLTISAILNKE